LVPYQRKLRSSLTHFQTMSCHILHNLSLGSDKPASSLELPSGWFDKTADELSALLRAPPSGSYSLGRDVCSLLSLQCQTSASAFIGEHERRDIMMLLLLPVSTRLGSCKCMQCQLPRAEKLCTDGRHLSCHQNGRALRSYFTNVRSTLT
jgi:hypothetical protein